MVIGSFPVPREVQHQVWLSQAYQGHLRISCPWVVVKVWDVNGKTQKVRERFPGVHQCTQMQHVTLCSWVYWGLHSHTPSLRPPCQGSSFTAQAFSRQRGLGADEPSGTSTLRTEALVTVTSTYCLTNPSSAAGRRTPLLFWPICLKRQTQNKVTCCIRDL